MRERLLDLPDHEIYMAKVDSMFNRFKFKTPEGLNCAKENRIQTLCFNPHCEKKAMMCHAEC